jgi:hypothetical protein
MSPAPIVSTTGAASRRSGANPGAGQYFGALLSEREKHDFDAALEQWPGECFIVAPIESLASSSLSLTRFASGTARSKPARKAAGSAIKLGLGSQTFSSCPLPLA